MRKRLVQQTIDTYLDHFSGAMFCFLAKQKTDTIATMRWIFVVLEIFSVSLKNVSSRGIVDEGAVTQIAVGSFKS